MEGARPLFQLRFYPFLQIQPCHKGLVEKILGNSSVFLKVGVIRSWLCFQFNPPEAEMKLCSRLYGLIPILWSKGREFFWTGFFISALHLKIFISSFNIPVLGKYSIEYLSKMGGYLYAIYHANWFLVWYIKQLLTHSQGIFNKKH